MGAWVSLCARGFYVRECRTENPSSAVKFSCVLNLSLITTNRTEIIGLIHVFVDLSFSLKRIEKDIFIAFVVINFKKQANEVRHAFGRILWKSTAVKPKISGNGSER